MKKLTFSIWMLLTTLLLAVPPPPLSLTKQTLLQVSEGAPSPTKDTLYIGGLTFRNETTSADYRNFKTTVHVYDSRGKEIALQEPPELIPVLKARESKPVSFSFKYPGDVKSFKIACEVTYGLDGGIVTSFKFAPALVTASALK